MLVLVQAQFCSSSGVNRWNIDTGKNLGKNPSNSVGPKLEQERRWLYCWKRMDEVKLKGNCFVVTA